MKKILLILVVIVSLLIIIYFLLPVNLPVITYHDLTNKPSENDLQIEVSKFEQEMKYLKKHHYKTLKLKDVECYLENKCKISRKSVLITFDDGWKNQLELAAPILKKYNLNAVIFYIGINYDGSNPNFMDEDDITLIRKKYKNIELASHSYNLHYDNSYQKSYEEMKADFKRMNKIIDTKYFAYPYGKYDDTYLKVLKNQKYKLAFTFGPDKNHRKIKKTDSKYELPRLNISNSMSLTKFKLRLLLPY